MLRSSIVPLFLVMTAFGVCASARTGSAASGLSRAPTYRPSGGRCVPGGQAQSSIRSNPGRENW